MIGGSSDSFLLGWLASAAIGGIVGAAKGRAFAGAVWGLILGPLGWLVIFVAPDQRPKCPECGGEVILGANRCKNCGFSLKEQSNAEVIASVEVAKADELALPLPGCPGCSSPMVNGTCSLCGFAIAPSFASR
jgi:hypothetical protein